MTEAEIKAIVNKFAELAEALRDADPDDKAKVFCQLALKLTYHPRRDYLANGSVALPVVARCTDVSRSAMIDVAELVGIMFSGLSAPVIEDIRDAGEMIVVRARTRDGAVACPGCGAESGRVHGYHERTAADVPADGRRVVLKVRARRMRCPTLGCAVQTFREQVPGVAQCCSPWQGAPGSDRESMRGPAQWRAVTTINTRSGPRSPTTVRFTKGPSRSSPERTRPGPPVPPAAGRGRA